MSTPARKIAAAASISIITALFLFLAASGGLLYFSGQQDDFAPLQINFQEQGISIPLDANAHADKGTPLPAKKEVSNKAPTTSPILQDSSAPSSQEPQDEVAEPTPAPTPAPPVFPVTKQTPSASGGGSSSTLPPDAVPLSAPTIIETEGTYYFTGDIEHSQDSFVVKADNIVLDGAGFESYVPIHMDSVTNVVVRNMVIDPEFGIIVNNTNDSYFINLTFRNITNKGIYVTGGSSRNIFQKISIQTLASASAIYVEGGEANTFDCQGGYLTGANSSHTYGLYSSRPGTTIKNCQIQNFSTGVFLNSPISGNSTILNNTIFGGEYGVLLYSSSNNLLEGNNAHNQSVAGYHLSAGSNNTLTSNNAYNSGNYGFWLAPSIRPSLTNNSAHTSKYSGFLIDTSTSGTFSQNKNYGTTMFGFSIMHGSHNYFSNNYMHTNYSPPGYGALYISGSYANTFLQNTINSSSTSPNSAKPIYLNSNAANNTFSGNILLTSSNSTPAIYASPFSSNNLFYLNNISSAIWINDSGSTNQYNSSSAGNIYYYPNGTGAWEFYEIVDSNPTAWDGWADIGELPLNPAAFPSAWLGSGNDYHPYTTKSVHLYDCADIKAGGATYFLEQSIISTKTSSPDSSCFIIKVDDITLDCQGHTITGPNNDEAYGVFSLSSDGPRNNITVKNCVMDGFHVGIFFDTDSGTTPQNNKALNNTISTADNGYGIGAYLNENLLIANNTITAGENSIGIIFEGENVSILNNTIKQSGSSATAIETLSGSETGTILLNNISTSLWINNEAGATGLQFSDSESGNIYYYPNGTGAWELYEIVDSNSDKWADAGGDLPFAEGVLTSTLWSGPGADYRPYTPVSTKLFSCANLTYNGATYTLEQDVAAESEICMQIMADGITLDCQGHKISDSEDPNSYGVLSLSSDGPRNNITVKNCQIEGFHLGIFFDTDSDSIPQNNKALNNTIFVSGSDYGIGAYLNENLLIANNTILLNAPEEDSNPAAIIFEGENVQIYGNTITQAGENPTTAIETLSGSETGTILHNNISTSTWINNEAGATGLSLNDSSTGNIYYFANGTPAWQIYDIIDFNQDGWADTGKDSPLSSLTASPWLGYGADYHPYSKKGTKLYFCANLTGEGGNYTLEQDVAAESEICMQIMADDITLDCQGHKISDSEDPNSYGVLSFSSDGPRNNITVKNCQIEGFHVGIFFDTDSDSIPQNNKALNNTIFVSGSDYGIGAYLNENLLIANNTITAGENSIGIIFEGENISILENTIKQSGSQATAIETLSGSETGTILHNNISTSTWINNEAGATGLSFSDSESGNIYYYPNGTGAWEIYELVDSNPTAPDGWADIGQTLSSATASNEWLGEGVDYHPYTQKSTHLYSCAGIGAEGGYYTLEQNITSENTNSACFTIKADSITLDCQGNSITGPNNDEAYGVLSLSTNAARNNITVKNCVMDAFHVGIFFDTDSVSAPQNNKALNNTISTADNGYGIGAYLTENLLLEGNTITAAENSIGIIFEGENVSILENTIKQSGSQATAIETLSGSETGTILLNNISTSLWINNEAGATGLQFSDSAKGNIYYYANGAPSWTLLDITDSNSDLWADAGADLPFSSATLGSLWLGDGEDSHPYTQLTP